MTVAAPAPAAVPAAPAKEGRRRRDGRGRPVEVITPEGVPLRFVVAGAMDRFLAVFLDLAFIYLTLLLVVLVLAFSSIGSGGATSTWATVLLILFVFLLRYGYFTMFELRGRGATPGKRIIGIRVVDAAGGPLTAEAVIVRNLLRELEIFAPLILLLAPEAAKLPSSGAVSLAAALWALGFGLVPFCNRRRLRMGDLLAGTMVVVVPKTRLLADIGRGSSKAAESEPAHRFTQAQLDVYGERELLILEEVLRSAMHRGVGESGILLVAQRIANKIGAPPPPNARWAARFLREYYAALRARLEHRMLLGRRKRDKHSK